MALVSQLFLVAMASHSKQHFFSHRSLVAATNYGGPVDGMQPYDPSFGTLKGSCGYGIMDKTAYPYWSVVGISTSSRFYTGLSGQGCG